MSKYWLIIPAGGVGSRCDSKIPKQYLEVQGKSILAHCLDQFLSMPFFEKIVVVVNPQDTYWKKLNYTNNPKILVTSGGEQRGHSVLNGLQALKNLATPQDWILVHDAVRPFIEKQDVEKLISCLKDHAVGGLLGVPLRDTVKQINQSNEIEATLDRSCIWSAYTPQMFRFNLLMDAMQTAIAKNYQITDEASAIERMGLKPLMVEGRRENIKITYPEDLKSAEVYFSQSDKQK